MGTYERMTEELLFPCLCPIDCSRNSVVWWLCVVVFARFGLVRVPHSSRVCTVFTSTAAYCLIAAYGRLRRGLRIFF